MKNRFRWIFAIAAFGTLSAVQADDADIIDYRQHVMRTIGEQAELVGMIAEGKGPPEDLASQTRALAVAASIAKSAFEPKIPGGKAKPEVWARWAEFSKELDKLAKSTADLAESASSGGVKAVAAKLPTMSCKSCHDTFRTAEP